MARIIKARANKPKVVWNNEAIRRESRRCGIALLLSSGAFAWGIPFGVFNYFDSLSNPFMDYFRREESTISAGAAGSKYEWELTESRFARYFNPVTGMYAIQTVGLTGLAGVSASLGIPRLADERRTRKREELVL